MLVETLKALVYLIGYFIIGIGIALALRILFKIPSEIFRKSLHIIATCSGIMLIYGPFSWQGSAAACIVFAILVFPILTLAKHIPKFSKLMSERKEGELRTSLVAFSITLAILIVVCWGWVKEKYLATSAILAWGIGDATAALVGKRFGRRFIEGKFVEGRKSLEGTLAMVVTASLSIMTVLLINNTIAWYNVLIISFITGVAVSIAELYTKKGMDTVTCPLTAIALLIPLTKMLG